MYKCPSTFLVTFDLVLTPVGVDLVNWVEVSPIDHKIFDHALTTFELDVIGPTTYFQASPRPIFNFFVWTPLASYGTIRQKESWTPMAFYGAERVNCIILHLW